MLSDGQIALIADCDAIWDGLSNGTFTILSSDHCPFRYNDSVSGKKTSISPEFPEGHFKYIPNGCPGIETRLALTLSAGRLALPKFVELTAANPAKLYGLYPLKGALKEAVSDAYDDGSTLHKKVIAAKSVEYTNKRIPS